MMPDAATDADTVHTIRAARAGAIPPKLLEFAGSTSSVGWHTVLSPLGNCTEGPRSESRERREAAEPTVSSDEPSASALTSVGTSNVFPSTLGRTGVANYN